MALGAQKLKSRINSIKSTKKITSAMELIANVKLKKQRQKMENNREYAKILKTTVNQIVKRNSNSENVFLKEKEINKKITFVFSSDMGLCGGYNANMIRLANQVIKKEDPMIVIGRKQLSILKSNGFNIINEEISSDNITFSKIKELVNDAIDMYLNNEISGIQALYTEFVNTVTFEPRLETLLPCLEKGEIEGNIMVEFEPNEDEILNNLIPMMVQNVMYSILIQSKTSEHASRRLAMENASDNAEELSESLTLKYNQARQAAITQEITEIVGGADAL